MKENLLRDFIVTFFFFSETMSINQAAIKMVRDPIKINSSKNRIVCCRVIKEIMQIQP